MSIIDAFYKMISVIKYAKPKTFTYGVYPQSIKASSVNVTPKGGLYEGDDGDTYVAKVISCKKSVTFSDGQKFTDGQTAYFKVEPIVWEIGGFVYDIEKVKKGRTEKDKWVKRGIGCISKCVLAPMQYAQNQFYTYNPDEKYRPSTITVVAQFGLDYRCNHHAPMSTKWHGSKKATDFAIACGVTVKGKKAYHTAMNNGFCVTPSGKSKSVASKVVAGEVLRFAVDSSELKKLRQK